MKYETAGKAKILPVTLTQRELLERTVHPDCMSDPRNSWVIASAVLVRPHVDLRRLHRAYKKLLERHDTLRIRFELIKNAWRAVIDPVAEVSIEEIDLGDVDEVTFRETITEIATAPMALVGCPQAEMALVRCGRRGDVVVWRVNESITDGYGNIVLTEDLLKFLIGMPVPGRAVSHAEFIAHHEGPRVQQAAGFDDYWMEMHRRPPKAPDIGRKAKGLPPNILNCGAALRRLSVVASQESILRLKRRCAAANVQFVSGLFSGFLEGLCQTYGVEDLLFSANISRTNPALANFAGHATFYPVLRYRAGGSGVIEQAARHLGAGFMAAMQHAPSRMLYKGSGLDRKLISEGAYPRQFDCNQPRPSSLRDRSIFAEGLKKAAGDETTFGGLSFSHIELPEFNWAPYDMMFRIADTQGAEGFHLLYDGLSYDAAEARRLAHAICDLLGLEAKAFSTAVGPAG